MQPISISRILATCFFAFVALPKINRGQEPFAVAKSFSFVQLSPTTYSVGEASLRINAMLPRDTFNGTVRLHGGSEPRLLTEYNRPSAPGYRHFEDTYRFPDYHQLNTAFPIRLYYVAAEGSTFRLTFSLNFPSAIEPPQVTNFDALQVWNGSEFTINWNAFSERGLSLPTMGITIRNARGMILHERTFPFSTASITVPPLESAPSETLTATLHWSWTLPERWPALHVLHGELRFPIKRAPDAPVIVAQPVAVTAVAGSRAVLSVTTVGEDVVYQWFRNGSPVRGANNNPFVIAAVHLEDAGSYTVEASNVTGRVMSTPATLTVIPPTAPPAQAPSISAAPVAQTVVAGTSVTLRVTAAGTEPLTYQWLRDGEPVAGATSNSLTLAAPRPSDSGSYSVRVTNQVSTLTSTAAALIVNPVTRIANLSIRTRVGGSAGMLTVGLAIGGSTSTADKPVLLRAVGPTLDAFGVDSALRDPRLAILRGPATITQNDDWSGNPLIASTSTAVGAFALSSDTSKDAALLHAAAAGSYTVQITGAANSGGVALAEVYDTTSSEDFSVTTPRLTNVSALTQVGTGGDILIAGFAISGVTPKTVLIRGIGPTLSTFGVSGPLADPRLEIFQNGITTAHASNDNWATATNAAAVSTAATNVGAFALAADSRDAALLVTLPPGSYTAQISGINNTTGTALVEVYEVP